MIAKAKAIAHGSKAIEYALRESKHGYLVMSNLVQNQTPGTIYKEFLQAQEWNTRCKNKFIRIEIGIAPADEKRLGQRDLERICSEFSERFGFKNHQWIACTHRDTEHLHLHMIVNRIGIDHSVYDTSFISKKAGKIAEGISRDMGLTIANQVKRQSKYRPEVMSFERILARTRIAHLANEVLASRPQSLEDFKKAMGKHDVKIEDAVNRKGNTYGLRFTGYEQTFKGSQIGKEFGYGTLLKTFSENRKAASENINSEIAHKQSQCKSIKGELLPGIGAVVTAGLSGRGNQLRETEEERRRKRNMNKKYGRKR
jgi:hypothetical protein